MTCLIVCDFLKKYDLNPKEIIFPITKVILSVNGTTANLELGDKVFIKKYLKFIY